MNRENTYKLIRRFPVLYQDFFSTMQETAMCWGFDHLDGWEPIIWQLSLAIEDELGYTWFQKKMFLLKRQLSRRWNNIIYKLSPPCGGRCAPPGDGSHFHERWGLKRLIYGKWGLGLKRFVWFPDTGHRVDQVKEKFGTLRYYCAGNDRIFAFIRMAEQLSAITCEFCGKPGELREDEGWMTTLCDDCNKKQEVEA
jgi:hypothetical protein